MKKLLMGLLIASATQISVLQSEPNQREYIEKRLPKDSLLRKTCEQQFSPFIHDGVEYKHAIEMQCDCLNGEALKYETLEKFQQKIDDSTSLLGIDRLMYHADCGNILLDVFTSENKIFCAIDTILSQESDENKRKELALWLSLSPLKDLRKYFPAENEIK